MLPQCWPIVCDAGPPLIQHWFNVSCLLGCMHAVTLWAAVCRPIRPTWKVSRYCLLALHGISVLLCAKYTVCYSIMLRKAKRWYLLTLQVSRYRLWLCTVVYCNTQYCTSVLYINPHSHGQSSTNRTNMQAENAPASSYRHARFSFYGPKLRIHRP